MNKHELLDAAILAYLKGSPGANFYGISLDKDVWTLMRGVAPRKRDPLVSRRLQALKKAGVIRNDRGWWLVEEPT